MPASAIYVLDLKGKVWGVKRSIPYLHELVIVHISVFADVAVLE